MRVKKETPRNVEINDETWKNIGVLAAQIGITKKEAVTRALDFYYHHINKNK